MNDCLFKLKNKEFEIITKIYAVNIELELVAIWDPIGKTFIWDDLQDYEPIISG